MGLTEADTEEMGRYKTMTQLVGQLSGIRFTVPQNQKMWKNSYEGWNQYLDQLVNGMIRTPADPGTPPPAAQAVRYNSGRQWVRDYTQKHGASLQDWEKKFARVMLHRNPNGKLRRDTKRRARGGLPGHFIKTRVYNHLDPNKLDNLMTDGRLDKVKVTEYFKTKVGPEVGNTAKHADWQRIKDYSTQGKVKEALDEILGLISRQNNRLKAAKRNRILGYAGLAYCVWRDLKDDHELDFEWSANDKDLIPLTGGKTTNPWDVIVVPER